MANRKSKPKVLSVNRFTLSVGNHKIRCKEIMACFPLEFSTRKAEQEKIDRGTHYKTNHVLIRTVAYFNGRLITGISANFKDRLINPKRLDKIKDQLKSCRQESIYDLDRSYLHELSKIGRRKGIVQWFDRSSGYGRIHDTDLDLTFSVYACNLKGAKTGYPETACVYLNDKSEVEFDLMDCGDHSMAVNVTGPIQFDQEAWDRLDHSRLAFRKDENGNFINGLFA